MLQCGELFRDNVYDTSAIHFNNVLLLQAKYDEFSCFRDLVNDELLHSGLLKAFSKSGVFIRLVHENSRFRKKSGIFFVF